MPLQMAAVQAVRVTVAFVTPVFEPLMQVPTLAQVAVALVQTILATTM